MLLLIDNYDSFTYNLVQFLGELGADVSVFRNDAITSEQAIASDPEAIVLSPGPCGPAQAGVCIDVVRVAAKSRVPILGVCLGHQVIGEAFGGKVVRNKDIVHGKLGTVFHDGSGIFSDLPSPFSATRYHSLIVDRSNLPDVLDLTAWLKDGTVMGIRHRELPIFGVQFHPESIASEHGHSILKSFLQIARDENG